jgi:hypothetical protein
MRCLHVYRLSMSKAAPAMSVGVEARVSLGKVDHNAEGKALRMTRFRAWMSNQPFGLWLARVQTGASSL